MNIHDVYVTTIRRFSDRRGFFQEVFSTTRVDLNVQQINVSVSSKNVVRGMHVAPFAKFCTCVRGRLFDVVADVRPDSPTYLQWDGVWLDENNLQQLYVPAGCAHGFFAAQNDTMLLYLQDGLYNPQVEREVNWRDPQIGIVWPEADDYILSDKDASALFLNGVKNVNSIPVSEQAVQIEVAGQDHQTTGG